MQFTGEEWRVLSILEVVRCRQAANNCQRQCWRNMRHHIVLLSHNEFEYVDNEPPSCKRIMENGHILTENKTLCFPVKSDSQHFSVYMQRLIAIYCTSSLLVTLQWCAIWWYKYFILRFNRSQLVFMYLCVWELCASISTTICRRIVECVSSNIKHSLHKPDHCGTRIRNIISIDAHGHGTP